MLNYIKAELYRNFNRLYFWLFTGILAGGLLAINVLVKIASLYGLTGNIGGYNVGTAIEGLIVMIIVPVFLVIVFVDMVTAEEHKNLTLRNTISFGLNRKKVILSKFITSAILAFISAIIILTVFLGSTAMFFGVGSVSSVNTMKLLAALALWSGALAVGLLLALIFKNGNVFSFMYLITFAGAPIILKILISLGLTKFEAVNNILITTQLSRISEASAINSDVGTAVLIGVVYIIVFLALSMVYFDKEEVK